MLKYILLLVTASLLSTLALGCMPNSLPAPALAFEPRPYGYVPQLGPDGPQSSELANGNQLVKQ